MGFREDGTPTCVVVTKKFETGHWRHLLTNVVDHVLFAPLSHFELASP